MTKSTLILLFAVLTIQSVYGVTVGPRPPEEKSLDQATISPQGMPERMDIPAMKVAVPVLGANLDEFSDRNETNRVWPEIRKTEAIRSATKIRDALIALNQFESVTVFPNTEVSADLFVLGEIMRSDGEIMTIRWRLVDATGKVWIPSNGRKKETTHRVPLGWHQRFGGPGKDPFQKLYNDIAADVYAVLQEKARAHKRVVDSNKRKNNGKRTRRLSELENIVAVRELVIANYFAPRLYGDYIKEENSGKSNSRIKLVSLPDQNDPNWVRLQSFVLRDAEFANLMNSHYDTFRQKIDPNYEEWLRDIYGISREIRRLNRRANLEKIMGAAITLGAIVAAENEDNTGVRDRILAVGGIAGSALLIDGFLKGANRKTQIRIFNELANSYHDSLADTRVELEGKTIELKGTATEQFTQWRELLYDLYTKENSTADGLTLSDSSPESEGQ